MAENDVVAALSGSAEYTSEQLETARRLFMQSCEFVTSAAQLSGLPESVLPEIALIGRSNVGKSSLLNALVNQKNLARTSVTPGRTQMLNFFCLSQALILVDLPGYGYAKAPKDQVEQWTRLVKSYLKGRQGLQRVCLLIDSRHGVKDSDREMMDMLDACAVTYQLVLTKLDKIGKSEMQKVVEQTLALVRKRPAAYPFLAATSSVKGWGIAQLRADLSAFVGES